jgi:hypothetical protein
MPRTTDNTQRHAAQPVRRACCAEQFCVAKAPSGSYSVEKLIDGRSAFADGRLRSGNVQKNAFASSDATCPVRRTHHASARRAARPMRARIAPCRIMHGRALHRADTRRVTRPATCQGGARLATCQGVRGPPRVTGCAARDLLLRQPARRSLALPQDRDRLIAHL